MPIIRTSATCVMLAVLLPMPAAAAGAASGIDNGDFEAVNATGKALRGWTYIQPQNGDGTLSLDAGRTGGRCARVCCTRHEGFWGPGLGQTGTVGLEKGKWYTLSFWARGEDITSGLVAALRDLKNWNDNPLWQQCHPGPSWRRFSARFRAGKDLAPAVSRLQFHFDSVGTLWIDDVTLEECEPPRPANLLDVAGRQNLLPNSSFECGPFGWGTCGADELFGVVDASTAVHGSHSFRIDWRPALLPTYYNDFTYALQSRSSHFLAERLLLSPIGYAPVKPGRSLTFSTWLKTSQDAVPVIIAIVEGSGKTHSRRVQAGTSWKRFWLSARPADAMAFVTAGLAADDPGRVPATLWLDGLQLEQGETPTDYVSSFPVEFGIETKYEGNIYSAGETVAPRLLLYNPGAEAVSLRWALRVEDFFGKRVHQEEAPITVPGGATANVTLAPGIRSVGFYRLHLTLAAGDWKTTHSLRLAVIRPFDRAYPGGNGFLGINHAFVSDLFMRRCRAMGVTWVRSWFAKWEDVEPEKGRFDFREADLQAEWLRRQNFHILLCLSDPAAKWSSTAPVDLKDQTHAEAQSRRVWWLPRDFDDYERYVREVTKHFAGRVQHYEIFNEPTDTKGGKNCNLDMARNYATFVQRARSGAKSVSGDSKILSTGLYYLKGVPDLRPVLGQADILSEHYYPGLAPTAAFQKALAASHQAMRDCGCLRPIWITEYGLYADDDPDPTTLHSRFMLQLDQDSEKMAAIYAVKHHVIALASGVEKIFYHIGNWPFALNREHSCGFHPFFEYGGVPRKPYVALNALANLLPPGTRHVGNRTGNNGLFVIEFAREDTAIAVVWAEGPVRFSAAAMQDLKERGIRFYDVTGAEQDRLAEEPGDCPWYLVAAGQVQRQALGKFLSAVCRAAAERPKHSR